MITINNKKEEFYFLFNDALNTYGEGPHRQPERKPATTIWAAL